MQKVVSGPIVRRLTANEAYIWLVTSGDINHIEAETISHNTVCGSSTHIDKIELGSTLTAYLIKLTPHNTSWEDNQATFYNININGKSIFTKNSDFFDGLIPTYPGYELPFFKYVAQHKKILNASCRKPHGGKKAKKNHDALATFDRKIGNGLSIEKLPSLLFLTGDQVYADDVEETLAEAIALKSQEFFPHEAIPHTTPSLNNISHTGRETILTTDEGFYSEYGHQHLIGFREYLTMYFAVWGGLKLTLNPPQEKRPPRPGRRASLRQRNEYSKYKDAFKKRLIKHNKAKQFLEESQHVRRLLAHISTYMIFDDHEVTDDWNLANKVYTQLSAPEKIGQRVVTNALVAYNICQHWGNNPAHETHKINNDIKPYIAGLSSYDPQLTNTTYQTLNNSYTFVTPTMPPALVVDTRTQRGFNQDNPNRPLLVDNEELDNIADKLSTINNTMTDSLIVISPAPVYGFAAAELGQLILAGSKLKGATVNDFECWIANEDQRDAFVEKITSLATIKDCYVFSGDVHYGYVRMGNETNNKLNKQVNLWQFTSSSVSNVPVGALKYVLNTAHKISVFFKTNTDYLLPNNHKKEFLTGHINLGLLDLSHSQNRLFKLLKPQPNGKWQNWTYQLDSKKRLE